MIILSQTIIYNSIVRGSVTRRRITKEKVCLIFRLKSQNQATHFRGAEEEATTLSTTPYSYYDATLTIFVLLATYFVSTRNCI